MGVTIYDIARAANTTNATVSRALRDNPRISVETRQKIKKMALELGYRPNHAGMFLKSGKTQTLGIILPDIMNPYYIEFQRAVEIECFARGYQVMGVEFSLDAIRERLCLEQMLERRCDGFIAFVSRFEPLKDLIEEFWTNRLPFVVAGLPSDIGDINVDGIKVDVNGGVEMAVDHLVTLGHRNIVLAASWPSECGSQRDRFPGLERGLRKHGLNFSSHNIFSHYTGNQLDDGHYAAGELLKLQPKTTAVIGVNDLFITGFMRGLSEMGIKVPGDISLIGTDNTWISRQWLVSLTSIDLKVSEQAHLATEILFNRLNTQNWSEPRHAMVSTDLVIRESTGLVRKK
jgi:LacI family transcriptional regulator